VNVLNPTTASITFSPSTVNYGSPVTITGVIDTPVPASNAALKPTGTISLYAGYDGQITNGVSVTMTAGQSGNWEIQVSATFTPSTSEFLGISYNGDTNYAAVSAQSSFVTVIIPDFSLNIPSTPFNITAGQSGTLQISVVPATNNSSPVTLSCNGNLPIGYSCSLQPATLNLANGATSTATLTLSPPSGAAFVHNSFVSKRGAFIFPLAPNPLWPLSLLSGLAALLSLRWAYKRRDRLVPTHGKHGHPERDTSFSRRLFRHSILCWRWKQLSLHVPGRGSSDYRKHRHAAERANKYSLPLGQRYCNIAIDEARTS